MAISNTAILIKRSLNNPTPSSLAAGELAFSYASNNIFIGTASGTGAVAIGGKSTYDTVAAATSANTANTLVFRDAAGNFAGHLTGTATKADQLTNSRNFSISGSDITASAQGFDGTGAVTLNASLNDVPGLTAGTVGSTTSVPIITYGANGRILSITSEAIATSLGVAGDTGTDSIPGGETLTFTGAAGITTAVSNNTVTFDVDTTVVRSNTAMNLQTIDGDITISGNLSVLGTQSYINTETLNIADPLIFLSSNNVSDVVDIGFLGHYTDGSSVARHTGVFRNAGDKEFYVFDGYTPEPDANNDINVAHGSFNKANLNVGFVKSAGIISNGINLDTRIQNIYDSANTNAANITIIEGVNTTQNTSITAAFDKANSATLLAQGAFDKANTSVQVGTPFTVGTLTVAGASNTLISLANSEYVATGSVGAGKALTSLTVDEYGRVTAATFGSITGNVANLAVSQGGTGATSFTAGQILLGNGTNAIQSLANSTYTETGSGATNNTLSALTVDAYGRLTAATFSAISGLTVAAGGTGFSTAANNGIVFGNGTAALGVTAVAGSADQTWSNQILTVTNAGVPVWTSTMDGGSF